VLLDQQEAAGRSMMAATVTLGFQRGAFMTGIMGLD
jgi:hypothetical protein